MITSLPLYLFVVTSAINLLMIHYNLPVWVYENIFFQVNEWIGNSILFNVYMAFHLRKIDFVNRVCLLGLFAFNIVNLLYMNVKMDFEIFKTFTIQAIILTVVCLLIVRPLINKLWLKKLRN